MTQHRPRISVVIPVHNSQGTIGKCLDALRALNHSDFEVILVDDGSVDQSAEICDSYAGAKVLRLEQGGPSRARNEGIRIAEGEFVAFTDDDCIVDKDWLSELESGFTDQEIGGVGGDQRSPEDESEFGKTIQDFFKGIGFVTGYIKTETGMSETEHNPSCNSMYRREVLDEVGGFDEGLFPGEDVALDYEIRRRGLKLIYNSRACVGHYRPSSLKGFARMMRAYGACQRHLVGKYGFFRLIQYEPIVLVTGLILSAFFLAWNPNLWPLVLLVPLGTIGWFLVGTRDLAKSLQFSYLMAITLIYWNLGFFTGR
jgi:glycosyltransferase involved in cell wall biosynthesis